VSLGAAAGRVASRTPIDALAVARVTLRAPDLDRPRAGDERYRNLKLPVIHRDDLVDERRRCQQRLRWHLHQLDPGYRAPAGALSGLTVLAVGSLAGRRKCRCASPVTSLLVAAR
jgi:transposase